MADQNLPEDFLEALGRITNKRARVVIDTILEKGYCTTEDIAAAGYDHPPRAARDVKEEGIPLCKKMIKNSDGKRMASYYFGDWKDAKSHNQLAKTGGRKQLTANLKKALINKYGAKCHLFNESYDERLLQPDHRIPFEIGGDPDDMMDTDYFMLLCPSANRNKSWACEHCPNWVRKEVETCRSCYYAFPENYEHIACKEERKIDLIMRGSDIKLYHDITRMAEKEHLSNQEMVKRLLAYGINHLEKQ